MDFEHKSYREACVMLDIQPEFKPSKVSEDLLITSKWQPRSDSTPDTAWQSKASAYLFQCFKYLMSAAGKEHRDWLNNRGISNEIIKTARLGWNTKAISFDRESWGLIPDENEAGKQKQIWIPEGLVIPYFKNDQLVRLRIRQSNLREGSTDRFLLVAGSSMDYMTYPSLTPDMAVLKKTPCIVVESELDGWLLHDQIQKTKALLTVFAIGNSSSRPNQTAHEIFIASKQVNICLDNDEAGNTETIWWMNQYHPRSRDMRMLKAFGKDPGEAFKKGFDFTEWLMKITDVITGEIKIETTKKEIKEGSSELRVVEKAVIEKTATEAQQAADITIITDRPKLPFIFVPLRECFHGKRCSYLIADPANTHTMCSKAEKRSVFDLDACPNEHWFKVMN